LIEQPVLQPLVVALAVGDRPRSVRKLDYNGDCWCSACWRLSANRILGCVSAPGGGKNARMDAIKLTLVALAGWMNRVVSQNSDGAQAALL